MSVEALSLELRWFGAGDRPAELVALLDAITDGARFAQTETRRDVYLPVIGRDSIGIKLRGGEDGSGKFEIKMLGGREPDDWISGGARGRAETWRKIGWPFVGDALGEGPLTAPELGRAEVEKQRRHWLLLTDGANPPRAMDPAQWLETGCQIELTRLRLIDPDDGRLGWTLALESFGPDDTTRTHQLRAAFRFLFSDYVGGDLDMNACKGYPRWILDRISETRGSP